MDQGLISRRYAKALLEYATQRGESDLLYGEMKLLAGALASMPELRRTLEGPMVDKASKMSLICEAGGGSVAQSFRDFAALVLDNHRERFLHNMALGYIELYRKVNNINVVSLTSVAQMPSDMIERIRDSVVARTHGTVEFEIRIDPSIEGGFIFQIDDMRLDASVRGQLDRVRRQFIRSNRTIV